MKKLLLTLAFVSLPFIAYAGIEDYSTTASSNGTVYFEENMSPADVNNDARSIMADIRTWYESPEFRDLGDTPTYATASTFTISGDVTSSYTVGMRVEAYGTTMGTLYGTITASSYSAPNTTVTVSLDSGSLTANLSRVSVGLDPTNKPLDVSAVDDAFDLAGDNTVTGENTFSGGVSFSSGATFTGSVDFQSSVTFATSISVPAGSIIPYAGTSAPTGWLLCYGQAVSRTTYSDLFSAIGTTYGSGDGSTTFNVPDCRGRVVAGQDDMGGTSANRLTDQSGGLDGDTLGDTGGSETHTLTTTEMPAHTHGVTYSVASREVGAGNIAEIRGSGGGTENTTSAGSDGAHNNVQPTIILNYIIKI